MALTPATVRVAVIIPARNAGSSLPACLAALRREHIPGPGAELIVIDDNSSDDTAVVAERDGARVLHGSGRGPAAARNLGARCTEADVLVFLDADTAPEPGWLKALLEPFTDERIVAVKGRYVTRQRGVVPRFSQLEFEEKYARLERAVRIDFVDTGTAAFRRQVFMNVGGFDESFPAQSAEDVELAFRLAEQGAEFAFANQARVSHTHAESLTIYLRKKARYGYFRASIYQRHPTKLKGDSYTPPWMGIQIILAGSLPIALLGALNRLLPRGIAATLGCALIATCVPLMRRAVSTDPALLPWVVPLSCLRAFAQGLGLAYGLLRRPARLGRFTKATSSNTTR